MHGLEGATEDFGKLCSGGHSNRERASEKPGKPMKAFGAEHMADGGHKRASAEVEEVNDQKVGDAAQNGRIRVGRHPEAATARNLCPCAERADHGSDRIAGQRDQNRHPRTGQQRLAPAVGAEAYEFQDAGLVHCASLSGSGG
jgi:hypothetical protein